MRKHIIYPKEEQLFLELAHLDELEIRFNFVDNERLSMFYFYGENYFFRIDKKNKCAYVRDMIKYGKN
ncbi:hypothetical protein M0Q50_02355 [bacterium]|jgi:hypothetical protein|nr:hypothetical protein [bacterium]